MMNLAPSFSSYVASWIPGYAADLTPGCSIHRWTWDIPCRFARTPDVADILDEHKKKDTFILVLVCCTLGFCGAAVWKNGYCCAWTIAPTPIRPQRFSNSHAAYVEAFFPSLLLLRSLRSAFIYAGNFAVHGACVMRSSVTKLIK